MTEYTLFIMRDTSTISLRRFLILSKKLFDKYNLIAIFFDIEGSSKEYLDMVREELYRYYLIEVKHYKYISMHDILEDKHIPSTIVFKKSDEELINLFLSNHYDASMKYLAKIYTSLSSFLDSYKIVIMFSDIATSWASQVMIDACKYHKIPTVSMEHAEGMGYIYSHLPPSVDFYIAYGHYNKKNLKNMGVKDDQILLTGSIETDLMLKVMENKEITITVKSILLILKPSKIIEANDYNKELIKTVIRNFKGYHIFIKLHPSVIDIDSEKKQITSWLKPSQKLTIVDISEPLVISLSKVSSCVTFNSFALIESILMKKKVIYLNGIQDSYYPNWNNYNIKSIAIEKISDKLTVSFLDNSLISQEKYNSFVKEFRYVIDNQNLNRISHILNERVLLRGRLR